MSTPGHLRAEFVSGHSGVLHWAGGAVPCAFGREGLVAAQAKREGDWATPMGVWPLRRIVFRADRLAAPASGLPVRAIAADDGWCDAPEDGGYNRPVTLPYPASHEVLMREDGLYDVIVVLGHNDDPPVAGLGSAIFFHCAKLADGSLAGPDAPREALNATAGCVAIARETLLDILAAARPGDAMEIVGG